MNVDAVYLDDATLFDCADPSYPVGLTSENLGSGPDPRAFSEDRPTADGSVNRTRYWGPRLVELVGYVQGADRVARTAALDDLRGLFTLREAHALRFVPSGLAERHLDVVVASRFDAPVEGDPPVIEWSVVLEAPDPRMYGALVSASYEPFTGGSLTIENDGTAPVPVVLTMDGGDGTLAAIHNVTTGEQIVFGPALGLTLASHLTLDTRARTVTLEGSPAPEVIDASATSWWELAPGTNEIEADVSAATAGLELTVAWRPGWL